MKLSFKNIWLLFAFTVITSVNANAQKISYEYKIGEKLASSFSQNCSLFVGTIDNFYEQKVDFTIQEHLWGSEMNDNKIQLIYNAPRRNSRLTSEAYSPWDEVELQKNNKLFVSHCENGIGAQSYKLIVSKQKLLPSIKEVIEYHNKLKQNPNVLLEVPKLFDKNSNLVFAGYIISFLRNGWLDNRNNAAIVLSELFGSIRVPTFAVSYIRITLRHLLAKEGEDALSPEAHNLAISTLVNVAAGNEETADQAIVLLLELSSKDKLNIEPFLTEEKRRNLLKNYRIYINKNPSQTEREKLERQLQNN